MARNPHHGFGQASRHLPPEEGGRLKARVIPQNPFSFQVGGRGKPRLGEANMFPAGVRSPPLRGVDHPRARRPCGASPGITREGVFSEGRGLRARTARHHGLRKVSSMGESRREAWSPTETCLGQAGAPFAGVRSPPLQERRSKVRWPYGGKPGDDARGGFLGGTHSVRPRCEAARRPRHLIPTTSVNDGPVE